MNLFLPVAVCLAVSTLLVLASKVTGRSPLLRLLVPSWRFFEEVGEVPELWHREGSSLDTLGPWQLTLVRPNRGLILNWEENLFLAKKGLLGHLLSDVAELTHLCAETVLSLSSYKLVCNMVTTKLRSDSHFFQFKLVDAASKQASSVFFISGVHGDST